MLDNANLVDNGIDSIGCSAAWLQKWLSAMHVPLSPGAHLSRALDTLEDFGRRAREHRLFSFPTSDLAVSYFHEAYGADFLTKMLHRGVDSGLSGFDAHFRDVASGEPLPTAPGQSTKGRNLVWELVLAAAAATFADSVVPVEPPDLRIVVKGRRVGIAAKVLYSDNPKTWAKRIKEGAEQIERAEVDDGIIVVNLVQQYPVLRMFRNLRDAGVPSGAPTINMISRWGEVFWDRLPMAELKRALSPRTKTCSIAGLIPALVPHAGLPITCYLLSCVVLGGRQQRIADVEHSLNWAFQKVFSYRGTPRG